MRSATALAAASVGAVVLTGCMASTAPGADRPSPTPSEAVPLAAALNDAGLCMFRAAAEEENLAVSPVSIGLAFGMVAAGASTPVDDALRGLFGYPAEGAALLGAFNSLDLAVSSEAGDGAADATGETVDLPVVRIANSAWFDESFTPEEAYVDAVRTWFGAEATTAPLREDPAGSRARIDGWVEDRTEGLIPRILPDSLPNDDTAAILVNTVYMKAQWWSPFEADSTRSLDFHLLDGTVAQAELMTQGMDASCAVTDTYAAAALPYVGDLEMLLVVPHEGRFEEVRDSLDAASVDAIDAALTPGHVLVRLPRFETESTVDLRDVIEARLGVTDLFDTVGLDGIGPELVIDAAVHATKVIVDEEGTEAAAATAIGIAGTSMPLYDAEVIADRPFLYLIRDTTTGAILFVGQYLDPDGA